LPRFIKQRDNYSCGPVAIVNALKWAGVRATYAHVTLYSILCETEKDIGTQISALHKALTLTKAFKVVRLYNPSIKRIDEHVDGGGAVLFASTTVLTEEDYEGHYALIVSRSPKKFGICNLDTSGNSYRAYPRNLFIRKYMKRFKRGKPVVWLLTAK
jgi:hypothetical protein